MHQFARLIFLLTISTTSEPIKISMYNKLISNN